MGLGTLSMLGLVDPNMDPPLTSVLPDLLKFGRPSTTCIGPSGFRKVQFYD